MRESIGSSLLLTLVIIFVSLIILFFVSILSYSKAFKAKNRIIEVIEKHEKYDDSAELEIKNTMRDLGYQLGSCKDSSADDNNSGYAYCIERVCNKTKFNTNTNTSECDVEWGYYYKVTTYMQFYFPIINELYNPPVRGETKILGKNFNY